VRGVMAPWDRRRWAGNWKEKSPDFRSRRLGPKSPSAARREGVHRRSSYMPSQTPEPVLRCLDMPRAIRPPALGLRLFNSFTVSRNTSPMTSVSVSGVVCTRAANFLMRLFGAITASPNRGVPALILADWYHCTSTTPQLGLGYDAHRMLALVVSTDVEESGFCEVARMSRPP
jgi:hypothetical protein